MFQSCLIEPNLVLKMETLKSSAFDVAIALFFNFNFKLPSFNSKDYIRHELRELQDYHAGTILAVFFQTL